MLVVSVPFGGIELAFHLYTDLPDHLLDLSNG
jgi:hypothetical protein